MIIHTDIIVTGKVQGVGFRAAARKEAKILGLTGWVQNWNDGTVHLAVEGDFEGINIYVLKLKRGSFLSRVVTIRIHTGRVEQYDGFEIRRPSL